MTVGIVLFAFGAFHTSQHWSLFCFHKYLCWQQCSAFCQGFTH